MTWVRHTSPEINSVSEYPAIIKVCLSLTTVMVVCVGLRAYIRVFVVKHVGIDDIVTSVAAIISVIYNGLAVCQTRLGLGLPVLLRPHQDLALYSVVNFAGRPLYMVVVALYKIAVCLAYLRLLDPAMIVMRRFVLLVLTFVVVSHLSTTFVIIFQCRPPSRSWEPWIDGSCLDNYPTWNATAAITIVCDVVVFLIPIPLFANLQMDWRRKTNLTIVFLLGLFTIVCSIMRMLQIRQVAKDGNNSTLVLWGAAEMNVGVALSCVPVFRTIFIHRSPAAEYSTTNTPHQSRTDWFDVQLHTLQGANKDAISTGLSRKQQSASEENILKVQDDVGKDVNGKLRTIRYEVSRDGSSREQANHTT